MSEVRIAAETRTEFGKGGPAAPAGPARSPPCSTGTGTPAPPLAARPRARPPLKHDAPTCCSRSTRVAATSSRCPSRSSATRSGAPRAPRPAAVRRGEKVTVDVPVTLVGEAARDVLVDQQTMTSAVLAEATHIPDRVEVAIAGLRVGSLVTAGDLTLPKARCCAGRRPGRRASSADRQEQLRPSSTRPRRPRRGPAGRASRRGDRRAETRRPRASDARPRRARPPRPGRSARRLSRAPRSRPWPTTAGSSSAWATPARRTPGNRHNVGLPGRRPARRAGGRSVQGAQGPGRRRRGPARGPAGRAGQAEVVHERVGRAGRGCARSSRCRSSGSSWCTTSWTSRTARCGSSAAAATTATTG